MPIKWLSVDIQVPISSHLSGWYCVGIDGISDHGCSENPWIWSYCNEYIDCDNVKSELNLGSSVGSTTSLSYHGSNLPSLASVEFALRGCESFFLLCFISDLEALYFSELISLYISVRYAWEEWLLTHTAECRILTFLNLNGLASGSSRRSSKSVSEGNVVRVIVESVGTSCVALRDKLSMIMPSFVRNAILQSEFGLVE